VLAFSGAARDGLAAPSPTAAVGRARWYTASRRAATKYCWAPSRKRRCAAPSGSAGTPIARVRNCDHAHDTCNSAPRERQNRTRRQRQTLQTLRRQRGDFAV